MRVEQQNHRLIIHDGRSECWIDPWGKDSLRVRMSAEPGMDDHDWALTEPVEATDVVIRSEVIDTTDPWYKGEEWAKYHQTGTEWTLTNGKITAKISTEGWITFLNQRGEVLTAEYWRSRKLGYRCVVFHRSSLLVRIITRLRLYSYVILTQVEEVGRRVKVERFRSI